MTATILTGVAGVIILIILVLIILTIAALALYSYRMKNNKAARIKAIHHKYSVIENHANVNPSLDFKSNVIQPPYRNKVKIKFVPSRSEELKRKKLEYSSDVEREAFLEKEKEEEQTKFEKSMIAYKEKFIDFFRNSTQKRQELQKSYSRPDMININENSRSPFSRPPRPNSVYEDNLGRILFTLYYSPSEEVLTVHLISGRNITSYDDLNIIRMPAISLEIEGQPESDVISTPDDAPNPEYDQEFNFSLQAHHIFRVIIRFIVWDIVSNHESFVIGFSRVGLASYQKSLLNGIDHGAITKEILPSLNESMSYIGELLVSLTYDCVTDKIQVVIRNARHLAFTDEDSELYIKISLLLDNDVIQNKRSGSFSAARNVNINQTFEFNALSTDLDKISNDSPSTKVANELLSHTSQSHRMSLDLQGPKPPQQSNSLISETLRNNMGILFSMRAKTRTRTKRVLGRFYLGRTNILINDEDFHWAEMIKNFDNTITQWHQLKLERF